ncbi:hypothetical protein Bphy_6971 (plasmid) [Paraburkholderia phymatum STM815]|uniref:Uncharacterized protein n=1 Tax=Paraburkholderia phymatum (strain DSM 17167 / CIP 108236 / LMG 21445 / STM815) TaxID=391038 RepID=B2JTS4_PARP8|nr:hypothetical protein Bphy_6971 [Paraburkholderia phymatum STM815]
MRTFAASHPPSWLATVVVQRKFARYARRYATRAPLSVTIISTNTVSNAQKPVGGAQHNAALWGNEPDRSLFPRPRGCVAETRMARRDVRPGGRHEM